MTDAPRRIVVAISGASGAVLGVRTLQVLRELDGYETHLVITSGGRSTLHEETDLTTREVTELADHIYSDADLGAAIASGSFRTHAMVVAPCSVKTLSAVANCYSSTLVARAADVTLKERRPLVLLVRETPFHRGHLRLMDQASEAGAIIVPPVPAFYARPSSVDEIVDHIVIRALDLIGLDLPSGTRWNGRSHPQQRAVDAHPRTSARAGEGPDQLAVD